MKKNLHQTLISLPLFDDPYLQIQAHNLEVVDVILTQMEHDVRREYLDAESTPASAIVLSALSQLWIFGLYEVLRTWQQRVNKVLVFAEEMKDLSIEKRLARLAKKENEIKKLGEFAGGFNTAYFRPYRKAASDPKFLDSVQMAKYRVQRFFDRLEALRINLAKHEKPSKKGSLAAAPGSGRLDMNGSIQWFVSLEDNEVDMVSRREIADQCRAISMRRTIALLPKQYRKVVGGFPRIAYGTWCIKVRLDDGSIYSGVIVAWAQEILRVFGHRKIPFKVDRIVGVEDDSKSFKIAAAPDR
jgi:hypothetical protein